MIELHLGDCREILPTLAEVDAVFTDPPYGINFKSGWTGSEIVGDNDVCLRDEVLDCLNGVPKIVFGSPSVLPPANTKATLIWHRPGSGMGDLSFPWKPDYEFIFVIGNGFSHPRRSSSVLSFTWDMFRGDSFHPHQKPLPLIKYLLDRFPKGCTILDPFMGSGTTGVACVQTDRNFIGIEIEPKYYEIAERRIKEAQMQIRMPI